MRRVVEQIGLGALSLAEELTRPLELDRRVPKMRWLIDRYFLAAGFSLFVGLIALTDSRMQIFAVLELVLAGISIGVSLRVPQDG
jgi:hypothetical protein